MPWERYTLTDLKQDVESGRVSLYAGERNGRAVGVMAVQVRRHTRELVVMAHGGEFGSIGRMMLFSPLVDALAKANGCDCVTGFVQRAGLVRAYANDGYVVDEIVMRKFL